LIPCLLVSHLLSTSLQIHDFQLILVLSGLPSDLFSLQRVHHFKHSLIFPSYLCHLLFDSPLQVAVTVNLREHSLNLLILLPDTPPELLDKPCLFPLLLPLLLDTARDVLVLPLDLDAPADARLDLETLLLQRLQLLDQSRVLCDHRTVLRVQLTQLVSRQVTLTLHLRQLRLQSRTVIVYTDCLLDLLLGRLGEVF
jgi:hypothetical protein